MHQYVITMTLSLTILIIAISLIPLKIAIFECTFALILCTPVIAFLAGKYYALTNLTYLISFLTLYAVLFLSTFGSRDTRKIELKSEFTPILIFILSFALVHSLTLKWPDFISIGERLRDFAILSSVIQSPIDLKEPWMSGYPLNYYAFWYRFGHMISSLFAYKTWNVYHLLQSFTYALYFTCAFRLFSKYLSVNKFASFFFAVLICFGSNLAGIKDYVFDEPGWWGPSRVIPGAINEFPAWSLILGDLHPHYLNLPLLPFFLLFFAYLLTTNLVNLQYLLISLSAFILPWLWITNSNVWDRPVWFLLASIFLGFYIVEYFKKAYFSLEVDTDKPELTYGIYIIQFATFILLSTSLYLSMQNIVTPDYKIEFVKGSITGTTLHDFCLHFGIPIFIICTALIFQVQGVLVRYAAILLAFYFFFFSEVLPLLIILLIIDILKIDKLYNIFSKTKSTIKFEQLLAEGIGIFALSLLMVPEIIFLNDPYGAEVERMNTIFKIYSVAWFFIHAFAFYELSKLLNIIFSYCADRKSKQGRVISYALVSVLFIFPAFIYGTGFFFVTADERAIKNQTITPYSEGLSEIDRLFPGSAIIIRTLRELPKGIVLEAQGKPYDYTTMIATLSENQAYLGWSNHVNLLLSNNPEVARREQATEKFYNEKDCNKKNKLLKTEKINYVIFGPLESAKYPESLNTDFSCLSLMKSHQGFKLYTY